MERLEREAEFLVFGVVTEYCVSFAVQGLLAHGRRVAVIHDAIETLNQEESRKTIATLQQRGARVTTTDEALSTLL